MDNSKSLRRLIFIPALFLLASMMAEVANCRSARTAIQEELSDTIIALARSEDNLITKQDTIQRLERINYAMAQPLVMIADQKMPGALLFLSIVSALPIAYLYRRRPDGTAALAIQSAPPTTVNFGHLTPMQRKLVELLCAAPDRCVPKREICAVLWGNKDNAEESLYTLIRRTKKSLAEANAEIICHRGESYQLRLL